MSFRRPPALARWLIERLGHPRRNAEIAGDLLEEFRSGRSAAWYWRQALIVAAHGVADTVVEMRPYMFAITAAYALQFVIALTLWSNRSPGPVNGSGWLKFGIWALFQFGFLVENLPDLVVIGKFSPNLKRLYCSAESRASRPAIVGLAAWHTFCLGLGNYCLCALVFPRFSTQALVYFEIVWFLLWVLRPVLLHPKPEPEPAEIVENLGSSLAIQQTEPVLTVRLPSGNTITLERQDLATTVFAAGSLDLVDVVFRRGRNLELLRNAIWLGGGRSRSYMQRSAESFTLADLDKLIDETAETESVVDACYEVERKETFPHRFKLWFFGDSA